MYSIQCDDCGEQLVAPSSTRARLREVVAVCVDCKTEWVFIYDGTGKCTGCRRAKPLSRFRE
jgi:RNase P subunit RPR2